MTSIRLMVSKLVKNVYPLRPLWQFFLSIIQICVYLAIGLCVRILHGQLYFLEYSSTFLTSYDVKTSHGLKNLKKCIPPTTPLTNFILSIIQICVYLAIGLCVCILHGQLYFLEYLSTFLTSYDVKNLDTHSNKYNWPLRMHTHTSIDRYTPFFRVLKKNFCQRGR